MSTVCLDKTVCTCHFGHDDISSKLQCLSHSRLPHTIDKLSDPMNNWFTLQELFALPAHQVTFGRSHVSNNRSRSFFTPSRLSSRCRPSLQGLALPSSGTNYYPHVMVSLALPGPPNKNHYRSHQYLQPPQPQTQSSSNGQLTSAVTTVNLDC
jgi:hypothetical protein